MARIAIVGAGVVGQATGRGFSSLGHEVVFCDVNPQVLISLREQGFMTSAPEHLADVHPEVTMVCVSTPTVGRSIDLNYIQAACETLARVVKHSNECHLIVIRSTLPPGTTEDLLIPIIERRSGCRAGIDFGVVYHPEFLREASAFEDFLNAWLVVYGSYDEASGRFLRGLYADMETREDVPFFETNIRTAEMVKYASNLYNATKISFTNEMWNVCQELGINGNDVMKIVALSAEGMWNPKYGIRGGFPYGGSCLPKDTVAFDTFAREQGMQLQLLPAVITINELMEGASSAAAD